MRCHFEAPPNVFDRFTPYAAARAAELEVMVAELTSKVAATSTNNGRLTELLEASTARVAELHTQIAGDQVTIVDLRSAISELETKLLNTRLWLGQVSQDLAVLKR